jgi:hypothetical protein
MNEYVANFIKDMMDTICSEFNGVSVSYAFEELTSFHIVEIKTSFEGNDESATKFKDIMHLYRVQIRNTFPNEDIIIGYPKKFHDMSNTLYSKESFDIFGGKEKSYTFNEFHSSWLGMETISNEQQLAA